MPVILTLRRYRLKDQKLKVILEYTVSSRPTWDYASKANPNKTHEKKLWWMKSFCIIAVFKKKKKRWFKASLSAVAQNFLKNSFPLSELTLETKCVMENGYTISNDSQCLGSFVSRWSKVMVKLLWLLAGLLECCGNPCFVLLLQGHQHSQKPLLWRLRAC